MVSQPRVTASRRRLVLRPGVLIHRVPREWLDREASRGSHYHRFIIINDRVLRKFLGIAADSGDRWVRLIAGATQRRELARVIPRRGLDRGISMPMQIRTALGIGGPNAGEVMRLDQEVSITPVDIQTNSGRLTVPLFASIGRVGVPHILSYREVVAQRGTNLPQCFAKHNHLVLLRPLECAMLGVSEWSAVRVTNAKNRRTIPCLVAVQAADNLCTIYADEDVKDALGMPRGAYLNTMARIRLERIETGGAVSCLLHA